jgi:hypothetical protein
MLVPITSVRRCCPNKAGRNNFDNNKRAISLTMKMSEALRYGRLHSSSLGLINFDDSLTNCEILQKLQIFTNNWSFFNKIWRKLSQRFGQSTTGCFLYWLLGYPFQYMYADDGLHSYLFFLYPHNGKFFHIALYPPILERISHVASTGEDHKVRPQLSHLHHMLQA